MGYSVEKVQPAAYLQGTKAKEVANTKDGGKTAIIYIISGQVICGFSPEKGMKTRTDK